MKEFGSSFITRNNSNDHQDPFLNKHSGGDAETVSTRSTMHSVESSRSRSREGSSGSSSGAPSSRGIQRKGSSRKVRTSRDLHRQERQSQSNHQEDAAFDAFGFSQDSAFGDSNFEAGQQQQREPAQRPRANRTRRRASLAAAPSANMGAAATSRNPPAQSQSFDGYSDLPSSRRGADPNRPANRRSGRRASIAAAAPSLGGSQTDFGYGDGAPSSDAYGYNTDESNSNEFGYGDGAPSGFGGGVSSASSAASATSQEKPRRGRRSSICGGLEGLKSDLKNGGSDPFASSNSGGGGSGEFSNNRSLGGAHRAQNIVVPMTAPEKTNAGRRSGRRASLLGSVGDAVGGLAHVVMGKEKEALEEQKPKSFLKDRGVSRQNSADGSIISSYTGDRDRRRRNPSMNSRKGDAATSYSDRIMAKK